MTVSGNKVNSIIVENDGEYETVSFQPVTEKTNEAIIKKLIQLLSTQQNVSHTSLPIIVV